MNFLEHIKDHFFTLDMNDLPVTVVTLGTKDATIQNDSESNGNENGKFCYRPVTNTRRIPGNDAFQGLMDSSTCPISYAQLADQATTEGKTDLDADNLDEAMFLFAFHLIKSFRHDIHGQLDPFMAMGQRYAPYWRARMHPDAWAILLGEIKHKLRLLGWSKDSK
jgi:hypothetical protein